MGAIGVTIGLAIMASFVMALFLVGMEKTGKVEKEDFWIFGRLFYNDRNRARALGLLTHASAGVVFAFLYLLLWSQFPGEPVHFIALGVVTGLLHGIAVAISQILVLSDVKGGFRIGLTHVFSHVVFGFVLGTGVYLAEVKNQDFVENYTASLGVTRR